MTAGTFQVVGRREYRGHQPGVVFDARLDTNAAQRAIKRGDIVLLEEREPRVPSEHTFPNGWLPAEPQADHRGAERRLTS